MKQNLVAIVSLICLVACKPNAVVVHNGSGLAIMSAYRGYSYVSWLNGEPIELSYAQSSLTLFDFPLLKGSNFLSIKINVAPPPDRPPVDIKFAILVKDNSERESNWTEIDNFDESGPFKENSYEFNSGFDLMNTLTHTSKDFDSIEQNKSSWMPRVQQLGLAFIAKLSEGNEAEWVRIWGPSGAKEFYSCRAQFSSTNGVMLKPVSEISDLAVDSGNYLMLLHSKNGILIRFFLNGEPQEAGYSALRFARSAGKWCVLAPDGHWWKLPDDLQPF